MNDNITLTAGIDTSKAKLDVALYGRTERWQTANALQGWRHLAAELAQRLVKLAGGNLERVYFTNSGSEGVETAIKFARARTGRA